MFRAIVGFVKENLQLVVRKAVICLVAFLPVPGLLPDKPLNLYV